jgi:hypothetical protein
VLALLGVWFFVPESRDPDARRLDWPGAVLAVVGVTALVFGIIEEPTRGWADARVLAGTLGGALVLAAFAAWELRTLTPLIDLHLFAKPRFTWATLTFMVVGAAMTGVLFVLTPFLQIVQGSDAQATGLRLLPLIAAMMAAALSSPRLTSRLGSKVSVAGGQLVSAAGLRLGEGVGLRAIAGSTRSLSAGAQSPEQVSFTPDGRHLIVTERPATPSTSSRSAPTDCSALHRP